MNLEDIAIFANRLTAHNERMVITMKDGTIYTGHFFNNPKPPDRKNNQWNFIIPDSATEKFQSFNINGEDIVLIKKILLF